MDKRVLLVAGCATTLTLAFFYAVATGITDRDVVAHHGLGGDVAETMVRAGDIFAVSPDGLRAERICALDLATEFVNETTLDAVYRNRLTEIFPTFGAWVTAGAAFVGEAASLTEEADEGGLRFTGRLTQLKESTPYQGISLACECEMARRLNNREKVCTVRSALVPQSNASASAFSYASYTNFVHEDRFKACAMERGAAVGSIATQACPVAPPLPWDVSLRKRLRLIEESAGGSEPERSARLD